MTEQPPRSDKAMVINTMEDMDDQLLLIYHLLRVAGDDGKKNKGVKKYVEWFLDAMLESPLVDHPKLAPIKLMLEKEYAPRRERRRRPLRKGNK